VRLSISLPDARVCEILWTGKRAAQIGGVPIELPAAFFPREAQRAQREVHPLAPLTAVFADHYVRHPVQNHPWLPAALATGRGLEFRAPHPLKPVQLVGLAQILRDHSFDRQCATLAKKMIGRVGTAGDNGGRPAIGPVAPVPLQFRYGSALGFAVRAGEAGNSFISGAIGAGVATAEHR
jgi:hypothetical protein